MSKWIKWTQSNQFTSQTGEMPIENVNKTIDEFKRSAIEYQKATNAEHVIYAIKIFNNNDELIELKLYEGMAMDDTIYFARTRSIKNAMIYAIHKNR